MLRQRVITACLLVVMLAVVLLVLPFKGFAVWLSMVFTVAAWEWANMAGLERPWQRIGYALLFGLLFAGLIAIGIEQKTGLLISLLSFALSGWLVAALAVMAYPQQTGGWHRKPVLALAGFWLLLPAWLGMLALQRPVAYSGLIWLVIAVVASADIGAYFAGRRFGKHKLAIHVSPGKTWEGFWGGAVASLLLALLVGTLTGMSGARLAGFAVAVLLTAVISVLGDLFESMVKRERGIKDSSQLLPGHGGVLDRVDGWTAAVPFFALLYLLSGSF